jgi:hypothetical protein
MPKGKTMMPLNSKIQTYKQPLQHDVEKAQEKDKIKPQDIFEQMGATKKKKKKY